ncbi:MAG TPA: tyrosine-type recombinase/integrase [Egibacteraceae bacterium]|nr:tyrosine-type recombinase/integrase [Egibacteraceae bacterium]
MPAISIQFRRDRKSKPWVVRYADGPSHRSSSFRTKADAQLFAAQLRTDQAAGEWISPDAGRVPLGQWAGEWLAAYVGRASSTQARARSALRAHILPRFADRHLSAITRFDVERMVNEIVAAGRSPATAEKALRTMSAVLAAAVDARLIRDNPCRGVRPPRAASRHEPRFLTPAEVEVLAACVRPPYDLLVRFTAYTGLRWGEVAALRAGDVDLLRRRATVARSLERGGTVKDTKTHSRRVVHLEPELADDVAGHLQSHGLGRDDLLWSAPEGGPLSYTNFRRRVWRPAVVASGLDPALRYHHLRHTCASWLIARGGTAKAVMAWMGHSTIKVTFDRYGHLFPHELEDLAASLSDLRRSPDQWGTSRATVGDVLPIVKNS